MQEIYLQKYNDNEWRFIHPLSIDDEKVYNQYLSGVELLDCDDIRAEGIFKELIAKFPYHIDAYNHLSLAFRNQGKTLESLLTAEKSYRLGKECFPEEFNFSKDRLIWTILENRPFLRACQIYGLECQYHNDYSKAIEIYNENLLLNVNDNQGIRYQLLEVYFATNNFKQARKLIETNSDDWSIEFKFGSVTLEVLEGNIKEADKYIKDAIKVNKYFLDEVVKSKHFLSGLSSILSESDYSEGIPTGSYQEAYAYWISNRLVYSNKKVIEYYRNQ